VSKTLWRIAQGVRRFVLENPDPFIVTIDQQGAGRSDSDIHSPLPTIVTKNRAAVVAPHLIKVNHGKHEARGESLQQPLSTVTAQRRGHAIVAPTLIQTGYGERPGQAARVPGLDKPLGALVDGQKHALVSAFMVKHFGGVVGLPMTDPTGTITSKDHHALGAVTLATFRGTAPDQPGAHSVTEPLGTITAGGIHTAQVIAFLTAYYGSDHSPGHGQDPRRPMRTLTAKARLGIVTVHGVDYQIVDIGMRMLQPHELLRAQFGRFALGYDMSTVPTKSAAVRLIGNSVPPEVSEALVRANVAEYSEEKAA
jgi:DNA (cytosine-5)-methyltransferase 1